MGSLSFLQGIVPTQRANPGLPHCRWTLHQLGHRGVQESWSGVSPFSSGSSRPRDPTAVSCRQSLYQLGYQGTPQRRRPGFDPWVGKTHGGGHGNPLQCSCPENPMDRGAWWAAVQGVAKSRTRLSDDAHTLDSGGIINKRKDAIFDLKELKV